MAELIDLTGQRFGKLTVIEKSTEKHKTSAAYWVCVCDCGKETVVMSQNLRLGRTISCGCFKNEQTAKRNRTHGDSKNCRLYQIWKAMRKRCNNPKAPNYYNYGARGIQVCKEWDDYLVFKKWALENGYNENLTIDRIDNDKGYSPKNCRWATKFEQSNNLRTTLKYEYKGEVKTISEFAQKYGLNRGMLHSRLLNYKWPIDKAIETPVRGKNK